MILNIPSLLLLSPQGECEKTKVELQCISLMSDAIAYGCP